jgi:sugar phosphate isomerase/epimerase
MQGRHGDGVDQATAMAYLADALEELGEFAAQQGVILIYEPLNRFETNLVNTIESGLHLLDQLSTRNVKLLADLFHMNIEEASIADSIRQGGDQIGHVHFVDSNRKPAGNGHIDLTSVSAALAEINYQGYVSAEALPWPDSLTAAKTTIDSFHLYFRN